MTGMDIYLQELSRLSVPMGLLGSDEESFKVGNDIGHRIAAVACSASVAIGSRIANWSPFGDRYISIKTVLRPSTFLLQNRFQDFQ
jgi:hypothetical protein